MYIFLETSDLSVLSAYSLFCCEEPELVENTSNLSKEPFTLIRPWPRHGEAGPLWAEHGAGL